MGTREHFDDFSSILAHSGPREALSHLLHLTDYRFIGIWRFHNGRANAALHIDRMNPAVLEAEEVHENATYCCYVRDSKGVFMTAHAALDARTAGHPARESVPAYCGVPLLDADGNILGTLCHYDVVPRDPQQIDLELMIQVAGALVQGGHVPPYPQRNLA
jgi:GAF domain-containing protein